MSARRSAATTQTPGKTGRRSAATTQTPGKTGRRSAATTAKDEAPKTGVAGAAEARKAKGKVDPTKIKQPVFDPELGWITPATAEQVVEVADEDDQDDDAPDGDDGDGRDDDDSSQPA